VECFGIQKVVATMSTSAVHENREELVPHRALEFPLFLCGGVVDIVHNLVVQQCTHIQLLREGDTVVELDPLKSLHVEGEAYEINAGLYENSTSEAKTSRG
jgi:hypothetical protein